MATPATGAFRGTPASIIESDEPQTVAIDEEPFELGDLRDDADGVGEVGRRRQHRLQRPPGELAVADLAPARRADAAGLADRERREVVVQEEVRAVGAVQRVDHLLVVAGAERGDDQRLGLAAGEERRAVGAGQHAHLGEDRAHRREVAPVDAPAPLEDVRADDVGLELLDADVEALVGLLLLAQAREDRLLRGLDRRVPVLLVARSRRRRASARRRPPAPWPRAPARFGASNTNGSFAASSARSMIRSITGCICSWPNFTAPSISASVSS